MIKYSFLPASIIALGILLRVREYLGNRSLWLDEANLALNLINKSFLQLTGPLDPEQYAPIGFLWFEKLAVMSMGSGEYALRFFPLIVSCLSLPLFYKVASYFLDKKSTLLALFLFSISDVVIYYSSEIKQYSFDVFILLILYFFILKLAHEKNLHLKSVILLSLIGSISIWFSHPAIFILAGIATVFIGSTYQKGHIRKLLKFLFISSIWFISFATSYLMSLKSISTTKELNQFWNWAFAPLPKSVSDLSWYKDTLMIFLNDFVAVLFPWIVILFSLLGLYFYFRNSKLKLGLLVLPVVFVTIASILHLYPLVERFTLFLVPIFLILFVAGVKWSVGRYGFLIPVLVAGLIFSRSLLSDGHHLFTSRVVEDIKPVLQYYSERRQPYDILYLHYAAEPAFKYYAAKFDLVNVKYITTVSSKRKLVGYIADLNKVSGNSRVWFIFSNVIYLNSQLNQSEEDFFVHYLNSIGKKLDYFHAQGATIYLYDLTL